jgi:hypothetical protein
MTQDEFTPKLIKRRLAKLRAAMIPIMKQHGVPISPRRRKKP